MICFGNLEEVGRIKLRFQDKLYPEGKYHGQWMVCIFYGISGGFKLGFITKLENSVHTHPHEQMDPYV